MALTLSGEPRCRAHLVADRISRPHCNQNGLRMVGVVYQCTASTVIAHPNIRIEARAGNQTGRLSDEHLGIATFCPARKRSYQIISPVASSWVRSGTGPSSALMANSQAKATFPSTRCPPKQRPFLSAKVM